VRPRRLLWDQRKLKAPQEQSDEETEAEPTESEVAGPVGFMHFYSFKLNFVHSLKRLTRDGLAVFCQLYFWMIGRRRKANSPASTERIKSFGSGTAIQAQAIW